MAVTDMAARNSCRRNLRKSFWGGEIKSEKEFEETPKNPEDFRSNREKRRIKMKINARRDNTNESVGITKASERSALKERPNLHRLLDIIEKHSRDRLTIQEVTELKDNIENWTRDIKELEEKISQIDIDSLDISELSQGIDELGEQNVITDSDDIQILAFDGVSKSLFLDDMRECINDFITSISDYESDEELYDYYKIDEPELSDYGNGEYDYPTKAKAKLACKEAIKSVWDDIMNNYEVEKENIISYAKDYFAGLEDEFKDFLHEFLDSYDEYAELECEGASKKYVADKKSELFDEEELLEKMNRIDLTTQSEGLEYGLFDIPMKDVFDMKECLGMCTYESDGEDYCFDMERACSKIYTEVDAILDKAVKDFPDRFSQSYKGDIIDFTEFLKERLNRL